MTSNLATWFANTRKQIARSVREMRLGRGWTQKELAEKLGLSQGRISQIEGGSGSFAAEHLVLLSRIFNVPIGEVAGVESVSSDAELQNALARLGAAGLREDHDVTATERFANVATAVKDALAMGTPRLLAALAPVVVRNIDRLSLARLDIQLQEAGLDRRLAWLAENIDAAIVLDARQPLPRAVAAAYRRAQVILASYLDAKTSVSTMRANTAVDVLDATIRSKRTLEQVLQRSSSISQRWGIATDLHPEQFATALEAARATAG
jgi:transcriptional regulator with XRE-family HTH domain